MTGIQTLERISPNLPMRKGSIQAIKFEYERHGRQTLLGGFNIPTGVIQKTRTEVDFINSIKWA